MVGYPSPFVPTVSSPHSLELGSIVGWHGSTFDIPAGWSLCNGTNGTPNLQNLFLLGAGGVYPVSDTGGADTHIHDFTSNTHTHQADIAMGDRQGGLDMNANLDSKVVTGTTNASDTKAPYYALCYIMQTG